MSDNTTKDTRTQAEKTRDSLDKTISEERKRREEDVQSFSNDYEGVAFIEAAANGITGEAAKLDEAIEKLKTAVFGEWPDDDIDTAVAEVEAQAMWIAFFGVRTSAECRRFVASKAKRSE